MLSAKSVMYGREFRIISRWEPTSQRCSSCQQIGGKKELSVRKWTCLYCGTEHDRDINAALNILAAGNKILVAVGQTETLNVHGGNIRPASKQADSLEVQTRLSFEQLTLF